MLRETATIVVARNERWEGTCATEPVECGWAEEAIFFLRRLAGDACVGGKVRVEFSPDGMHWLPEGTTGELPVGEDEGGTALRVRHFGNWLRIVAEVPADLAFVGLVTLHLK